MILFRRALTSEKQIASETASIAALKSIRFGKILKPLPDSNLYEFVVPWAFKSPSAASAVVLDRSSNGRIEWKVVGSRLTYHEWQEQRARS